MNSIPRRIACARSRKVYRAPGQSGRPLSAAAAWLFTWGHSKAPAAMNGAINMERRDTLIGSPGPCRFASTRFERRDPEKKKDQCELALRLVRRWPAA